MSGTDLYEAPVMVEIEKLYNDVVLPEYAHEDDAGMDIRAYFTREWVEEYILKSRTQMARIGGEVVETSRDEKRIIVPAADGPMTKNWLIVPTGIKVAIPRGYEIQVRPRSGLAAKKAITVMNTPGTIDSQYRGEVGVILVNHGPEPFVITSGDRIAQIVLKRVDRINWVERDKLSDTVRGDGGFGSTGK